MTYSFWKFGVSGLCLVMALFAGVASWGFATPVFANAGVEKPFRSSSSAKKKATKKKATKKKTSKPHRKKKAKNKRRLKSRVARKKTTSALTRNRRQLLISFALDTPQRDLDGLAQAFGLREIDRIKLDWLDKLVVKYQLKKPISRTILQRLDTDARTQIVQPNYRYFPAASAARQYALKMLKIDQARKLSTGNGVRIAILDSGVFGQHPALAGTIKASFDPIGNKAAADFGHGTAIASIIAAQKTLAGVAPDATVMSVRVFSVPKHSRKLFAETFNLIVGVNWAVQNSAKIVNMSFAGHRRDKIFEMVINGADAKGLVFVAAAGNRGPKRPVAYPAAFKHVIAVTAIDARNRLYRQANRGRQVAFAAPGVDILVAKKKNGIGLMSGTSAATAYMSGTIALLLQNSPQLTRAQIMALLSKTAQDLGKKGRDEKFGFGLVDPLKAIAGQN